MNLYCSPRHYSISRWKAQGIIRDKLHSIMQKEKTATYFINHLFNLYLFASSLSFSARSCNHISHITGTCLVGHYERGHWFPSFK
uniref:Uncharacterized protein n=1 Tax=Anguilla anguilla TaxID=7936 RepID=A0A0E9RA47_ANGAN